MCLLSMCYYNVNVIFFSVTLLEWSKGAMLQDDHNRVVEVSNCIGNCYILSEFCMYIYIITHCTILYLPYIIHCAIH